MYQQNSICASGASDVPATPGTAVAAAQPECHVELTVEVADTLATLEGLRPDYERLHRATANTSPFALHEWHMAWCSHFPNLDPKVHDELAIMALRNPAGDCVAIVPLIASRRRFGPFPIVSLDLLGGDPSSTEIRTPLVQDGYEKPAARGARVVGAAAGLGLDLLGQHGGPGGGCNRGGRAAARARRAPGIPARSRPPPGSCSAET